MQNAKTVDILPETGGAILCVRFTGTVNADDYTTYFEQPLEKIVSAYGHTSVLIFFDDSFCGWTPEAADLSFKCISTYSPKARRLAYVNAPDSRRLMMKMLEPISSAETRFFETAQIQDALNWVTQ